MKKIIKPIQKEISSFEKIFKKSLSTDVKLLLKISNYIFKNPGKRIRPILILLVSGLLGEINKKTYSACVLIELLHTATLVHDDIVDDAHFRRGKFSINNLWKNKIAVLVGDFLLSRGLSFGLNNNTEMLVYTSLAVEKMSEGEILQIQKSRNLDLSEKDYYDIIERKTGALFGCCFQLAAVSNNIKDESQIKELYHIGLKMGKIFQIKDDIIDYDFNNITGKIMGNDLKESKINLPLLYVVKNGSYFQRQKIFRILRKKKKTNKEIIFLKNIVEKKGGINFAINQMKNLEKEIIFELQKFQQSKYKDSIIELLYFIISRKK